MILKALRAVYEHDRQARRANLNDEARLFYHQQHSGKVMTELQHYLQQQLDDKQVESNSHLGQAIRYLLKHWQGLTQFLRVAGAPLDNNLCEQALKKAIKLRKVAMFHKTFHGAYVAGLLLSLIETAVRNQINPVDYLTVLQEHKSQVCSAPERWLPWNYQDNVNILSQAA